MRIAFFHELPKGGARSATKEMAHGLYSRGNIVDLYYVDSIKDNDFDNYKINKIFFYKFIPREWKGNDPLARLYKDTIELLKLYFLHKKIARIIDSRKYDLVFVNGSQYIEAPFVLRFLKTYKVFYGHDPNYRMIYEKVLAIPKNLNFLKKNYERLNRLVRKVLDRQDIRSANLILTNSEFARKIIFKTYGLESKVVYYGIHADLFKPLTIQEKDIDLLFIGSTFKIDGYDLLLESQKYLDKNLKVRILDFEKEWFSASEMRKLYCQSKVVLSLARNEPFGLIPVESMSCATPVVAVNEGGYKESVIDGVTGFLVKPGGKEIAEKVKLLLKNKKLFNDLSNNCRKEVLAKWTWRKRATELEEVLKKQLI